MQIVLILLDLMVWFFASHLAFIWANGQSWIKSIEYSISVCVCVVYISGFSYLVWPRFIALVKYNFRPKNMCGAWSSLNRVHLPPRFFLWLLYISSARRILSVDENLKPHNFRNLFFARLFCVCGEWGGGRFWLKAQNSVRGQLEDVDKHDGR